MDELKLRELKELRDTIIKRHIILMSLSFIISIAVTISFFIIKKQTNSFLFFLSIFLCHIPVYIFIFLRTENSNFRYQYIAGFSLILILCFSLALIIFTKTKYYQILCYLITLTIYHYTEFFSEVLFHFQDLQKDAFLIYENKRWVISTLSSFAESILGVYFFYEYKNIKILFILGLIMTIIGQYFRIAALFTGKSNFTHKIQLKKRKNHVLVKYGIYSICRHPSYFGFFIWSVGIEIMCVNPICTIAFAYILFQFFKVRIELEEEYLIKFFGMEYIKYRRQVGILMPFINISKEFEKNNLIKYLKNHEDEKNNQEIIDFLNENDKDEEDSSDDKEKEE
jgi:protein-S-isoprenylcysteine O-methyltransferase